MNGLLEVRLVSLGEGRVLGVDDADVLWRFLVRVQMVGGDAPTDEGLAVPAADGQQQSPQLSRSSNEGDDYFLSLCHCELSGVEAEQFLVQVIELLNDCFHQLDLLLNLMLGEVLLGVKFT